MADSTEARVSIPPRVGAAVGPIERLRKRVDDLADVVNSHLMETNRELLARVGELEKLGARLETTVKSLERDVFHLQQDREMLAIRCRDQELQILQLQGKRPSFPSVPSHPAAAEDA